MLKVADSKKSRQTSKSGQKVNKLYHDKIDKEQAELKASPKFRAWCEENKDLAILMREEAVRRKECTQQN